MSLIGVAACAGAATAIPAAAATAPSTAYPPPCPVTQLVRVANGNLYVSVGCTHLTVPLPGITR